MEDIGRSPEIKIYLARKIGSPANMGRADRSNRTITHSFSGLQNSAGGDHYSLIPNLCSQLQQFRPLEFEFFLRQPQLIHN
jgi:hypothetical protein